MNIKKHTIAFVMVTLSSYNYLLHADVSIDNSSGNRIRITPVFEEVQCHLRPCPGEIEILPYETGTIATRGKTLLRIIMVDQRGKKKHIKNFTATDFQQGQEPYRMEYRNGELKLIA